VRQELSARGPRRLIRTQAEVTRSLLDKRQLSKELTEVENELDRARRREAELRDGRAVRAAAAAAEQQVEQLRTQLSAAAAQCRRCMLLARFISCLQPTEPVHASSTFRARANVSLRISGGRLISLQLCAGLSAVPYGRARFTLFAS
jgi:hypothetical protein